MTLSVNFEVFTCWECCQLARSPLPSMFSQTTCGNPAAYLSYCTHRWQPVISHTVISHTVTSNLSQHKRGDSCRLSNVHAQAADQQTHTRCLSLNENGRVIKCGVILNRASPEKPDGMATSSIWQHIICCRDRKVCKGNKPDRFPGSECADPTLDH